MLEKLRGGTEGGSRLPVHKLTAFICGEAEGRQREGGARGGEGTQDTTNERDESGGKAIQIRHAPTRLCSPSSCISSVPPSVPPSLSGELSVHVLKGGRKGRLRARCDTWARRTYSLIGFVCPPKLTLTHVVWSAG